MRRETHSRRAKAALLAGAFVALVSAAAWAQSGQHLSMDGKRNLINRDVGNARWAISQDLDDGTLTGNVFFSDGSAPAFVQCDPTSFVENPDPSLSTYTYDCYGTETCTPTGCADWSFVASVTVSGSFFEAPPLTPSPSPTATPTPTPKPSATAKPTATPTAKPSATPTAKPSATPTPKPTSAPTPTPTPKPSPTPTPTPKPAALVVTPDKATINNGDEFLFVVTGGVPPYELHVTIGGTVDPASVAASGDPFKFKAGAVGTSTVIVVDSTATLKTVAVTVK